MRKKAIRISTRFGMMIIEPYREDADAQFSAAGYTIKESSDDDDLHRGRRRG